MNLLKNNGITQLYSHQAKAITELKNDKNVVICTSTSSGKSLTYIIPSIERLIKTRKGITLIIYPQKALAQDQFRSISNLIHGSLDNIIVLIIVIIIIYRNVEHLMEIHLRNKEKLY